MPEQPFNPQAVELDSTSVRVTWSPPFVDNGILLYYTVYYRIDSLDNTFGPEQSVTVDAEDTQSPLSIVLSDLVEFTVYQVAVSANTSAGEGARSVTVTVTTDPDSASPPRNVQVMALNSTAIEASFSYPAIPRGNISGYIIEYDVSDTSDLSGSDILTLNYTLNPVNDMNNRSVSVANLAPFTFYVFRVSAYSFSDDPFQIHPGEFSPVTVPVKTSEDGKLNN